MAIKHVSLMPITNSKTYQFHVLYSVTVSNGFVEFVDTHEIDGPYLSNSCLGSPLKPPLTREVPLLKVGYAITPQWGSLFRVFKAHTR